ncbi:uncharacterized protein [Periplaneta americana]|uniref:uncharacterized protein isoform X5 n=1 Tax=Periplaneta americana TaxID=6978 RepID=UPI0037E8E48F
MDGVKVEPNAEEEPVLISFCSVKVEPEDVEKAESESSYYDELKHENSVAYSPFGGPHLGEKEFSWDKDAVKDEPREEVTVKDDGMILPETNTSAPSHPVVPSKLQNFYLGNMRWICLKWKLHDWGWPPH